MINNSNLHLSNIKKALHRLSALSGKGEGTLLNLQQGGIRIEVCGSGILKRLNKISRVVPDVVHQRRDGVHLHEVGRYDWKRFVMLEGLVT